MHKIRFNYSLKNIGLPTRNEYRRNLIQKAESVVQRMRWKAHFFLSGTKAEENNFYGLPSDKSAPIIPDMKAFEDDLTKLLEHISFRNTNDPFLSNIKKDLNSIRSSKNIFAFADKTKNIYEVTPDEYNKLLTENITKSYKMGDVATIDDINDELKNITRNLNIGNRVNVMAEKNAFITLKDHKDNFDVKPKCRLINPAKSELGRVSKVILDSINDKIRSITGVNQWKNSQAVIEWFNNIEDKPRTTFVSFDVVDFYPSISEELLNNAISWARSIVNISDEHINIIKHARKSVLFNDNKPWVKRNSNSTFDVTMGSYDGAEICELVGLFALNSLVETFGKQNIGLYRDDGLALIKGNSGRLADKARKDLCTAFQKLGLKITAEVNYHVVNFLDITLNLKDNCFKPFRKPDNDPLYIHKQSNHPPSIIKHLPTSIGRRISSLSSNQQAFDSVSNIYSKALKESNFDTDIHFDTETAKSTPPTQTQKRKRGRNIIWFNPPFSKNVRTNVAKEFLKLVDKHFPVTSTLHKIFNRNTIKVSYCCLSNVKCIISKHNKRILRKNEAENKTTTKNEKQCSCRKRKECPVDRKCLMNNVVYKAEVTTKDNQQSKVYVGMTSTSFKERYRNHKKSFNNPRYENNTELSKYVWKLKLNNREHSIKWSILSKKNSITAGGKCCNLCTEEKLQIILNKQSLLNKRSELFTKCVHARKFLAGHFKRASAN